jgi:hypothetical protein
VRLLYALPFTLGTLQRFGLPVENWPIGKHGPPLRKKDVSVCPSVFVALSAALGVAISIVDRPPLDSPHNFTVPTLYGVVADAPQIALLRTGDHFDLLLLRALGDGVCFLSPLTISSTESPRASSTCSMTAARAAQL